MSRRNKPKKKGMHPVVAVLILLASVAFVVQSTTGGFGSSSVGQLGAFMDFGGDLELDAEVESQDEIVWTDLLAGHGSFDGKKPVRLAFFHIATSDPVPAAPGGETAPLGSGRWTGTDPPFLRLGVVMVSAASRRAVLAGSVVGVGDAVAGGRVVGIEPGTLHLRWQQRDLTYDLDSEVPREFRSENSRRGLEQQQSGGLPVSPSAQSPEPGTGDK